MAEVAWAALRAPRGQMRGAATLWMPVIFQEPERSSWPRAVATLWAAGVCARRLCYSSAPIGRRRLLLVPRLRAQIPSRATHGTSRAAKHFA